MHPQTFTDYLAQATTFLGLAETALAEGKTRKALDNVAECKTATLTAQGMACQQSRRKDAKAAIAEAEDILDRCYQLMRSIVGGVVK